MEQIENISIEIAFRNYGIFVLPAVIHFEDGVPNIYEGLPFLNAFGFHLVFRGNLARGHSELVGGAEDDGCD
jgi:hypothetical protein